MKSLLTILTAACLTTSLGCGIESTDEPLAVGSAVPEFSLHRVDNDDTFTADSLEGEVVVLNFWSTTCSTCIKEVDTLKQLHSEGAGRVNVVGIALDGDPDRVAKFAASKEINYPVLLGNEEVFEQFDGLSIPYTLVIDSQRIVRKKLSGKVELDELNAIVQALRDDNETASLPDTPSVAQRASTTSQ